MLNLEIETIPSLAEFLLGPTPSPWLDEAVRQLPLLLIDHAHCERKAAATALNFISKYPERSELVAVMSPLAREELLHFEKVLTLLHERHINFGPLPPANYAQRLHKKVSIRCGKERLCDQLIIGAIIEARSCERFEALASVLEDKNLAKFYVTLAKAEARHFQDYLRLAYLYGGKIQARVKEFLELEYQLIQANDKVFRFHSGTPV